VRARMASMKELQEARHALAAVSARLSAARAALEAIVTDYNRDRDAFLAATVAYRRADPDGPTLDDAPAEIAGLEPWLQQAGSTRDAWALRRDQLRGEGQFAATLKSTLEDYRSSIQDQRQLDELLPKLREAHDVIRGERQSFTDGVLSSISVRVNQLYEKVHPGEGAAALTMQLNPRRRASLDLGSSFAGKDVPPQAYYSQSHLDTLGICIFLALVEKDQAQDTILVLDDVLASLDEPHVERLVRMIASAASGFRHCVMTTHYRPWKEKLRWGLLKDGSTELLELKRWSLAGGMQLTRTVPEIERLREDLKADPIDLQTVVARAGVILEALLDHLTFTYECALPRKRGTSPYTIGDLLSGIGTRLRVALKVEVQEATGSAPTTRQLGPLLDAIEQVFQTRNAMGGHFTELRFELLDDDAVRFSTLVLELADPVVDVNVGWPMNDSSGSYWATAGETRKLHPLKRPG
jgi:hypothetical protein